MDQFLDVIPHEFWRTFGSGRYTQLRGFDWDKNAAFEYAVNEVEARKKIADSWGAEYAIFAIRQTVEFPLHGNVFDHLEVLLESPFPECNQHCG